MEEGTSSASTAPVTNPPPDDAETNPPPDDAETVPVINTPPNEPAAVGQVGPIMGQFIESPPGSNKFSVRVGGKPNAQWTNLDQDQMLLSTSFNFRKSEITDDVKAFNIRCKGLSEKFNAKDNLLVFQNHVWSHLRAHGLDTIAHLRNPSNPAQVIDVVHNHARFSTNIKNSTKIAKEFSCKFDTYDCSNE